MDVLGSTLGVASLLKEGAGRRARRLLSGAGGDCASLAVAADGGESDLHRLVASDLIMGQDRPIHLPQWTPIRLSHGQITFFNQTSMEIFSS